MGMNNAFRIAGRAESEQDQGVVIEVEMRRGGLRLAGVGRLQNVYAGRRERTGYFRGGCFVHNGKTRPRDPAQVFNLERSQARIDRDRATAELPNGEQLREEFETVAEGQEDAIARGQALRLKASDTAGNLNADLRPIPASAAERLD